MAVGLLIGRHVSVSAVVVPTSQAVNVTRKVDSLSQSKQPLRSHVTPVSSTHVLICIFTLFHICQKPPQVFNAPTHTFLQLEITATVK